jgi:hypothetical protein
MTWDRNPGRAYPVDVSGLLGSSISEGREIKHEVVSELANPCGDGYTFNDAVVVSTVSGDVRRKDDENSPASVGGQFACRVRS